MRIPQPGIWVWVLMCAAAACVCIYVQISVSLSLSLLGGYIHFMCGCDVVECLFRPIWSRAAFDATGANVWIVQVEQLCSGCELCRFVAARVCVCVSEAAAVAAACLCNCVQAIEWSFWCNGVLYIYLFRVTEISRFVQLYCVYSEWRRWRVGALFEEP